LTKRVVLAAVTIAAALLLLTAFSLQSVVVVLYPQIIIQQQSSSYAQEPAAASPITADGNDTSSSSTTTTDNNNAVDNNLTQTDGILTVTINGANFTRNQMIEVKGKVDDEVITPESGVWITVKDPMNETTHAIFVPLNPSDKSFSYGIVAGYYDKNSRGFYKPMTVSGKNCTMTVVYNTDDGPSTSSTTSSGNKSEVQFVFAYDHSITTEPQPQPQQTDGILAATINGANFVRNQTISVEGKVDDEIITPESGVWITLKDSTNETTHIDFAPVNMSDRSFSYSILAGYYDGNSYGLYKPMTVSGKNYTMTVVYNTDDGPSTSSSTTTTSSGNNKSSLEVQFVFAYDHSITTPVSAAVVTADTEPDSVASQIAGNQSTTTTTTTITPIAKTKTNGLLTATINSSYFTTNQTIKVNGTVGKAAGPFIAVYAELKDPQDETLAFEFAPIVRSNKSGSDNETSFSYSLVAGDDDDGSQDDGASNSSSDSNDTRRFWKPMNETGSNYTMTIGYATPAPPPPSSSSSSGSVEENSRSEVQFVFAYDHLPPPE
jgi:hypothetical protein